MKVDRYIEGLLRKWGREWFSIDLGYPHRCAYLKDYRPKGYRQLANDPDRPEVERLAEWMPINLRTIEIDVLRIRYRKKIRHKRKAARYMSRNGWPYMTEQRYREYFNDSIRKIEKNF